MSCIKHISNTSTTTAVKDLLAIPTQLNIVINALKPEVYLITVYISSSYLKEYTMCLYYNYHPPNIVQRNTCCLLCESYKTRTCTKWAKSRVSECYSRWHVTLGFKRFKELNFESHHKHYRSVIKLCTLTNSQLQVQSGNTNVKLFHSMPSRHSEEEDV
jgi:hypothetical protein